MIQLEGIVGRSCMLNFACAYTVLLPEQLVPGERIPLVIALHDVGTGRQGLVQVLGASGLVDAYRVAVALPEGRLSCFLNMAHGPRWQAYIREELLPRITAAMPCDASRVYALGVGAGALGALALARDGLPCALVDPVVDDPFGYQASRWPAEEAWLAVFEGQEAQWQPGLWANIHGMMTGTASALHTAAAKLGLAHWQAEASAAPLADKLAAAFAYFTQCRKG